MQINLYSKAIKNGILYLGWILFFLCLWCKGCSSSQPQIASVTVPAISNTLPADTIVKHETIEVPKWYKDRTNEKKLSKDILEMYDRLQAYQEEIDNMHSEYQNSDSIKQAELYRLAT